MTTVLKSPSYRPNNASNNMQIWRALLAMIGARALLIAVAHAGSTTIGDAVFNEIFHPIARRLVAKCDGCLRIGGSSVGADEMVNLAKQHGKAVDYSLEELPSAS